MTTSAARRAFSDVRAVSRCAQPLSALRWVISLATQVPECARYGALAPADRSWARTGARFRTSTGAVVSLPAAYTAGAREMYCRNAYLRSEMTMPGARVGLRDQGFTVNLRDNDGHRVAAGSTSADYAYCQR